MDDILHFDIYCHRKTTWRYSKIYFFAQKKLWLTTDYDNSIEQLSTL